MGWASGFRAGSDIARQAIDTYQKARQQREFDQIANATPEASQGYTAQDGDQLSAIANARDANGNPYYTIEAGPNGSYGIRSNFTTQGADGQAVTPDVVGMAPQRVTDFLGQRFAGDLDRKGIDTARYGAYADATARLDPVRGLQMRRELDSQQREDIRFEQDQRLQPMRETLLQNQVKTSDRTERMGQRSDKMLEIDDQIGKMTDDEIRSLAAKVNTNMVDLPLLFVGTNKGGYQFLTRDPKTGDVGNKPMTFNAAQMRDLARAHLYNANGFAKEGQELFRGVSKELSDLVLKQNQITGAVVQSANDALSKQRGDEVDGQKLALQRQANGIAASNGVAARRDMIATINETGDLVMVDKNSIPVAKDGTATLPKGLRLPPKESAGLKVNADGSVTRGNELWVPNPQDPTKYTKANIGPSALDKFLETRGTGAQGQAQAVQPAAVRPVVTQYNPDAFENAVRAVQSGDTSYLQYLQGWANTNQLTAGERSIVERLSR